MKTWGFCTQLLSKYVFKLTWRDRYLDFQVYHGRFEFGNMPLVKDVFACTAWSAKHLFCWDLKSLAKSFSLTKSVRGNNLNNSPDIKVSLQNWEAVICVLLFLCSFTTSVCFHLHPYAELQLIYEIWTASSFRKDMSSSGHRNVYWVKTFLRETVLLYALQTLS